MSEHEGEYSEIIAPGAFGDTPKDVPLRFGQGGPVIGTATVHPDGTVTAEVNTAATSGKPIVVEVHRPAVTLIEWLRVQLDAEERVALEAAGVPWTANVPGAIHVDASAMADNHALRKLGYVASVQHDADRAHIAAWHPARVLAEVKTKRAILDRLDAEPHEVNGDDTWFTCLAYADPDHRDLWNPRREEIGTICTCGRDERVEGYKRLLAQPYASREGWQDEWNLESADG